MVLVVGATGLVGRKVCERLLRCGENVRAIVREGSKEKLAALESAARRANVEQFLFLSFRRLPGLSFPLGCESRGGKCDSIAERRHSPASLVHGSMVEPRARLRLSPETAIRSRFETAADPMQKSSSIGTCSNSTPSTIMREVFSGDNL